jgi:hypothetical protein
MMHPENHRVEKRQFAPQASEGEPS